MRWLLTALLGSFLMALGSGGCSSGSGPDASCSATFTACGGDPTGSWSFDAPCNFSSACPGTGTMFTPHATGTMTFNADKTYSLTLKVNESGTVSYASSCLGGLTCAQLSQSFNLSGLMVKNTCTGDSQSCTCNFSENGTYTEKGTYAVSGDTFTTTASGGAASTPTGFCVNGSELDLSGGNFGGSGTTDSAYTAWVKQ